MKFTDRYISNSKPATKQYIIRESNGFAIRILPSGIKTWFFIQSLAGKRRPMNLGGSPELPLPKQEIALQAQVTFSPKTA